MAVKIIRKPSKVFRIECQACEAIFEYSFHDMSSYAIQCPCCNFWNDHSLRKRMPKESDVVEVVHAEWVGTEYDGYADGYPVYDKWVCSHCHEEFSSEGEPPLYNYCPECGAKMDGERREECSTQH